MKPIVVTCIGLAILAGCSSGPQVVGPPANVAGDHAYEAGNFSVALTHYEAHLAKNPDDVSVLYRQGLCHDFLGNPAGAIQSQTQVLRLRPGNREALMARAHAHYLAGDGNRAMADLRSATEGAGFEDVSLREKVVALGLLGQIAHAGGEFPTALEGFDQAVDLVRSHEGQVSQRMRRTLMHNRAATLYALGYYGAARDDFEEYLVVSAEIGLPVEGSDHYNGCLLNYMAEDFDRSREYFGVLEFSQLTALAEQTEDPSFFVAAESSGGLRKGWDQP